MNWTPEQIAAVGGVVVSMMGAFGLLLHQVAELRKDVNGKVAQLVEAAASAARKEGELAGRDYVKPKRTRVRVAELPEPDVD